MKRILPYLTAFLLPAAILFGAYLLNDISWGGKATVLAGDGYHQYVEIASLYSRILHSHGALGFFYTWTSGLGLNLWAFASYYMGSFFLPLTYFFNVKNMPDYLYLTALLKFGMIGLTSFLAFHKIYPKVRQLWVLSLSTSFALLSFLTSQNEIPMWQDVFILIPLVIWGLTRLQRQGKRGLYYVALSILFIQNYYFGFILAIFLVLYQAVKLVGVKRKLRKMLDFALTSVLSGLTAMVMLLPMYLDLRANGQSFTQVTQLLTDKSWALDMFAKNFVGSYDTTQYGAIPMIFVGILPLVLALGYFFVGGISWRKKLAHGLLLAFIIASFYFQWLDLMWQGFHTPNMFLHRYSWVFSLLIVLMALETLASFDRLKKRYLTGIFVFLVAGFTATSLSRHYSFLSAANIALTALFLAAFFILLLAAKNHWLPNRLTGSILLLFTVVEMLSNSYYQVAGVSKEWHYPLRSYYNSIADAGTRDAAAIAADSAGDFHRADETAPDTGNDSMKFGYNAISQFSSVRNSNSGAVMKGLGFETDGDFLNLRYPGNTLLMDHIFGVKYNINQYQPDKFGFVSSGNFPNNLSASADTQSLGIFVKGGYKAIKLDATNFLQNQTNFVNVLAKTPNQQYFSQFYATSQNIKAKTTTYTNGRVNLQQTNANTPISVTYGVTAPADSQCYISVPNITYSNNDAKNLTIDVPGHNYYLPTDSSGHFFNLGYFKTATKLDVTLTFNNQQNVSFDLTQFWAQNLTATERLDKRLSDAGKVQAQPVKNGANLQFDASADGQLFLTIPYDKGWRATLDGKPVRLTRAQSGFMALDAAKGKHEVALRFTPYGLTQGAGLSAVGILGFIGLSALTGKKRTQKI